jgi:dipeptidyl aminopeptidase/acylaminoacyl peptidase
MEAVYMRLIAKFCLSVSLFVFFAVAAVVAESHPFSVHDMLAMDRISDAQVSPVRKSIVFVVRTTDLDANRGRNDLWIVGTDGTGLRRMTTDPASDSSPRWSPDGKAIYFLSTRSGSSQVWSIPANGGEAARVTSLPLDVGSFAVSPDGNLLVVSAEVFPGKSLAESAKIVEENGKKQASGRMYDSLLFRHWDTWADGRRNHLFVVPAGGGAAVDIMPVMDADAPSKPFGGAEEYTFTPDSKSVVFAAREAGREEAWSTNFDLYIASIDGKSLQNLTVENKAWDTQPAFSPDGKTLAYLAMERAGFEADRFRIMIRSWPEGKTRVLTQEWDRSPTELVWSSDGKTIYASADNLGQHSLFAIDATTGAARTIVKDGTVSSPALIGGPKGTDRIVYGLDTLTSPVELFSVKADGSDARRLTDINHDKVAAARMGNGEQFSFEGANGDTVYGYVVTPADFDASKKYPVAFLIHGGPQGSFGNHFHYRWNPQAYAGAGYASVMIDFHGSTGYGQGFTDGIRDDWGGKPFVDLQKGLAAATARYPWLDSDRVAALGASYGGYMINWIAGNWPDRFRCLVVHDGNLDERFAYYATEELWFPEWEHGGLPWENPAGYAKHNPIDFVQNWKTPTMVVHGGQDFRVVETGGMGTFTALQRRGIPSQFLYFPDENHWVLKPANSVLWHDSVLAWLDQWTKK